MYSIIFYCRSIIFYLLTKFTLVNFVSKFSQLYFTTSQLYFTYFILYCTCFIFDLLTRFTRVTGVQTCALPICSAYMWVMVWGGYDS